MLQGDLLSVILFILCFNPLAYLINKYDGYMMGKPRQRDTKITHLSFVDDIKTYISSIDTAKQQLDIISEFSNDIGMSFGEDKCRYVYVERGKRKTLGKAININDMNVAEPEEEKTY